MERKTRRRLVFENEGSTEAQQVRWRLEKEEGVEGELPWAGDDQGGSGLIPVIAGGAKYEIALWLALEPRGNFAVRSTGKTTTMIDTMRRRSACSGLVAALSYSEEPW